MIGRELWDFMDPEAIAIAESDMATARREAQPLVIENRFVRKDGTPRWRASRSTALSDRHGNHTGGLAIVSGITASKGPGGGAGRDRAFPRRPDHTTAAGASMTFLACKLASSADLSQRSAALANR
jgi:hypothetical protein